MFDLSRMAAGFVQVGFGYVKSTGTNRGIALGEGVKTGVLPDVNYISPLTTIRLPHFVIKVWPPCE